MTWFGALPAFVVAAALVLVPGLAVGYALRLRGILLWSAAGPLSVAVTATSSIVGQAAHVRWSLLPVAAVTVAATCAAGAATRRPRAGWAPSPTAEPDAVSPRWLLLSWLLAAGVIGARLLSSIGAPGRVAQLQDNAFHLNAVRYVLDSGRGSPFTLGELGVSDRTRFYPAAWHDFVALLAQLTGTSIPVAVNVFTATVVCVVWPLGCLQLTSTIIGGRPRSLLIGAVACASFPSYPYLLFSFGVVYPWLMAVSMLPTVLALVLTAGRTSATEGQRWVVLAVLAGSTAAVGLAHPGVLVAGLAIALPAVVTALRETYSDRTVVRGRPTRFRLAVLGYLALLVLAWVYVRPPRVSNWDGAGHPVQALFRALLLVPVGAGAASVLVLALLAGVISTVRDRSHRWALWTFGIGVLMHTATQLWELPDLRWWLTGVWYSDPFRPAALLPVAALPLVVTGADRALDWARAALQRHQPEGLSGLRPVLGVVLVAGTLALTQTSAVADTAQDVRSAHQVTSHSQLLTRQELTLIERLDDLVPRDALVAGNPMTGAALGYALAERDAVEPSSGLERGPEARIVMDHLRDLATDPAVCRAVRALNVQFVLDFGVRSMDGTRSPGLEGLAGTPGFALVAAEGPARLYHVTGC
jgi:hypothetical protein